MEAGQTARNQSQDLGRDLFITQIDIFRSECVGDGLVKAVFIDKSAINHCLSNALPIQAYFVKDVVDLGRLQDVLLDEEFGDLFVVHGRSRFLEGGAPATPQRARARSPDAQSR